MKLSILFIVAVAVLAVSAPEAEATFGLRARRVVRLELVAPVRHGDFSAQFQSRGRNNFDRGFEAGVRAQQRAQRSRRGR